jgi:hypothetical protein
MLNGGNLRAWRQAPNAGLGMWMTLGPQTAALGTAFDCLSYGVDEARTSHDKLIVCAWTETRPLAEEDRHGANDRT